MPYMLVDILVLGINSQLLEYDASRDQAQAWNTFATVSFCTYTSTPYTAYTALNPYSHSADGRT